MTRPIRLRCRMLYPNDPSYLSLLREETDPMEIQNELEWWSDFSAEDDWKIIIDTPSLRVAMATNSPSFYLCGFDYE